MLLLTLIRHAKSSWDNPLLRDFDRTLNPRGQADAPLMGAVLRDAQVKFDRIISSPALRAISTAEIIASVLGYPLNHIQREPRIYDASVNTLLEIVTQLDPQARSVALFGHNPGFSELANRLAHEPVGELPTCAIVRLGFDAPSWSAIIKGSGRLIAFDYPKKVKRH
ncbi:MAG: histidine phosphatase family protein [Thiotrichales bacterium]